MRTIEGHEPAPPRRLRRGATTLVLAVCVAWATVALTHLFGVWLRSHFGPLAWAVTGLAWLIAAAVTALVVVACCLARRLPLAGVLVALAAVAATAIVRVDWTATFVHGYYRLHHTDFLAVAELSRTHRLGDDGGRLPGGLRHLALSGDPITHGADSPDSTDVWLPAWTGLVDGVTGYAYIGDPPAGTIIDCLGDPCLVRWSLGDGWSWVDTDVPAGAGPGIPLEQNP
jgi:hypothetical protein